LATLAREREREKDTSADTVKTMAYFCGAVIKTEGRVERERGEGTGERKAEWKAVLSPFPQSWNRKEEEEEGCNRSAREFRVLFITGSPQQPRLWPHTRRSFSFRFLVNDYRYVFAERKRAYFSRYFGEDPPMRIEAESSSRNSC